MATQPTSNFDFQNFYSSTLSADITSGSLTISINTVPTPTEGILILEPDSATNREIIYYTSKGASTVVCPSDGRGWDGTTAVAHLTGTVVIMAPVAYMLRMLKSGSLFDNTITGWTTLGTTPTYLQNNGNKEFVLTSGVDKTGILSQGMKVKFNRGTTPPTQAMSFTAASSQYATKASPTGITFTSAFTCEAWVYLNSYTASHIISRRNATSASAWDMELNASGQVGLFFGDGTNTGFTTTYQSLPLKRWVHVAAALTASTKSWAFYINGVLVPGTTNAGTATTIQQGTGNLTIGANTSGAATSFFDGYISEARVWSVAQSQANIQANMAVSLTGSETNLVALFQGNGNFNDLTTNANTLTATAGAIATQAANPYNATEYGIITKVTSTQITVFTGTDYNIPNQTLNSFYYSTQRAPFGFPNDRGKWVVDAMLRARYNVSTSANTWVNPASYQLSVPTGAWDLGYNIFAVVTAASTGFLGCAATLSSTAFESDQEFTQQGSTSSVAATETDSSISKEKPLNLSAQTIYQLNLISGNTAPILYVGSNSSAGTGTPTTVIRAKSAFI